MKTYIFSIICAMLAIATLAQAPKRFTFQAVIRDGNNQLILNSSVGMRTTILKGNPDDDIKVYQEFYNPKPQTNANGLITLEIGSGTVLEGDFTTINWADGPYFIKTEADPTGGSNYTIIGISQLLSVPYALHANTAKNITGGITETDPVFTAWDKSTGIVITESQISDLGNYIETETDPEFTAWDKSTGITITESQITDLQEYLTEELDDDPTNELQDLSSSKEGNLINLNITNGLGTTFDVSDSDADPTNELQTVVQEDYKVTLSHDGGSFITGIMSYAQAEIDALTPYDGLTVHNSTTNCINYYYLNNWFEFCGTCTPQPTKADAGEDILIVGGVLTVTLSANIPVFGQGKWSILSGDGGSFEDDSDPHTVFTGQSEEEYTLQWSITTSCGVSYDEVKVRFVNWVCGTPFTDSRDNNVYETVVLGNQCWMAENLKYLPEVSGSEVGTVTEPYYYVYDYNGTDVNEAKETDEYQTYGVLYNWAAAMNGGASSNSNPSGVQGVCPTGWHLPSQGEWNELILYVSSQEEYWCEGSEGVWEGAIEPSLVAKIKWAQSPNECSPGYDLSANNATGFSALPGGSFYYWAGYNGVTELGHWWSTTEIEGDPLVKEENTLVSCLLILNWAWWPHNEEPAYKISGHSVRCVKD